MGVHPRSFVGARTVVAVTSVEVLEALLQIAPQDVRARMLDCTLLLPGARVAAAAATAGWRGTRVQAETAEDGAMIRALADWARGPSPAA